MNTVYGVWNIYPSRNREFGQITKEKSIFWRDILYADWLIAVCSVVELYPEIYMMSMSSSIEQKMSDITLWRHWGQTNSNCSSLERQTVQYNHFTPPTSQQQTRTVLWSKASGAVIWSLLNLKSLKPSHQLSQSPPLRFLWGEKHKLIFPPRTSHSTFGPVLTQKALCILVYFTRLSWSSHAWRWKECA